MENLGMKEHYRDKGFRQECVGLVLDAMRQVIGITIGGGGD